MKPIFQIIIVFLLATVPALAQKDAFTVKNLKEVNSEYNDFHAIPFGDNLIVTSARDKNGLICEDPDLKGQRYADLFIADKNGQEGYKNIRIIGGEVKINYHDAAPTFHPSKDLMIFTRSYAKEPKLKVLQLFSAELVNGKWTNVTKLPFNSRDFSNMHATFSPDGKQVYFASSRPPGNHDTKDTNLWVVDYNEGNWGEPTQLKGEINSPGTDYFPFMDEAGRLFFSSNGQKGYGGLDIFMSENINGEWSKPVNLPKPINSRFDDFSYISLPGGKNGFLGSNRNGGLGEDDIYTWSNAIEPIDIKLIVVNKETDAQLGDAKISITPILDKIPNQAFLDKEKLMEKDLKSKKKKPNEYTTVPNGFYKVLVNKPGFEPLELTVSAADLEAEEIFSLPLVPLAPARITKALEGIVLNVQTLKPIPNSKVVLKNMCDGSLQEFKTDSKGEFDAMIDCGCDHELTATKAKFVEDYLLLDHTKIDTKSNEPIKVTLKLAPQIKKGEVIVLEDVYYDFDKADIRPDAALELDNVVRLMQRYSSLKIELGSHTDSRGNDEYNRDLSQRRANSAIEYIISRGISSTRVTARGYGESSLTNQCTNGVQCSDEEHQANRRTEITVTEFNEENVSIRKRN
jgi:outer membrane protein OmpA-like peptidoglycan-associated protein